MRRITAAALVALMALVLSTVPALADIETIFVEKSDLPRSLSPSKWENSPNSFSNKSAKWSNSLSNLLNGPNGNRRLLYWDGDSYLFYGYHVWEDGPLYILSPNGTRMFYSPSGQAVFDGQTGDFCGSLYYSDGQAFLLLTENGWATLLKVGLLSIPW